MKFRVPVGLVCVTTVGKRGDGGVVRIRAPRHVAAANNRTHVERTVLPAQGMVVANRQQQAHAQPACAVRHVTPAQHGLACVAMDHQLLRDLESGGIEERPAWPGRGREAGDAADAVRICYVRHVTLAADGKAAIASFDPGLESVDQHDASGRWRRRGQQDGMVAAGPDAAGCARGEAAQRVALEPFALAVDLLHPGSSSCLGRFLPRIMRAPTRTAFS